MSIWSTTAVVFAIGVAFHPILTLGPRWRTVALVFSLPFIALAPLLISREAWLDRLLSACISGMVCIKLYDLYIGAKRGVRPSWIMFLRFLPNLFFLVQRSHQNQPKISASENAWQFVIGLGQLLLGYVILKGFFVVWFSNLPFLIEHVAKALGFFVGVLGMFRIGSVLSRILFGAAPDPSDNPFLARTPADFWRRYNRFVQQFFYEDIFKFVARRLSPAWGTVTVFAVSGLLHEYVFSMTVGRFQGYQVVFFLAHGLAVAATARHKPKGATGYLWWAGTLCFNLATSLFFFASVNELVPFYSNNAPQWLFPA